jgi:quercetin dioxygenase-like cupin family protein
MSSTGTFIPTQITIAEKEVNPQSIPWTPHAAFPGVALKHLITGAENGGLASFHLVRVDPGCALKEHTHPGQWELHEVVAGSGTAILNGHSVPYASGSMALIPRNSPHQVTAGDEGLLILAKFFPALL